jgi:AcrR family transcriptional regulator
MNKVHISNGANPQPKDPNDSTRQAILNAAREIFVRDGFEGFSMRRLAAGLGCALGTPYVHFNSKEELFQTLVEQSFERLYQCLSGLRDRHQNGDPVVLLKKGMYTYIQFGLQNPNDYRFAFLLRALPPDQPYRVHPAFEELRFALTRCVDERRFREVDIETAAQALWAAIHGITSLLLQRPNFPWAGRAKVIEQVINNSVDSLIAPAEPVTP